MNGQQLHRIFLVVPASVPQPQFYLLVIHYPGTSGEKAEEGDKRPTTPFPSVKEAEVLGKVPHFIQCGKMILPPLSGNCWWRDTGSDGEGCLRELINWSKSLKTSLLRIPAI